MTATEIAVVNPLSTVDEIVTRKWLHDGQIVLYEIGTSYFSQRIVDALINTITETMQQWSPKSPYLALQHFTKGQLVTTPYAREQVKALASRFPNISGRIASVTSPACNVQMSQEWLNHLNTTYQPRLPHRIFFTKQEALDWLSEAL